MDNQSSGKCLPNTYFQKVIVFFYLKHRMMNEMIKHPLRCVWLIGNLFWQGISLLDIYYIAFTQWSNLEKCIDHFDELKEVIKDFHAFAAHERLVPSQLKLGIWSTDWKLNIILSRTLNMHFAWIFITAALLNFS